MLLKATVSVHILHYQKLTSRNNSTINTVCRSCQRIGKVSHLVKCWKDVVGKLDLSNGCGTGSSCTDAKSHNPLLTKRSVEDSVLTWEQNQERKQKKCH